MSLEVLLPWPRGRAAADLPQRDNTKFHKLHVTSDTKISKTSIENQTQLFWKLCMPSMAATLSDRRVVDDRVRRVAQEVLAVVLQVVEVRATRLVRLPGARHINALVADGLGS